MLLVASGAVLPDNLRKVKISEGEVRQQLRLAGVHRYDDVAALILERTGAVSVSGARTGPWAVISGFRPRVHTR